MKKRAKLFAATLAVFSAALCAAAVAGCTKSTTGGSMLTALDTAEEIYGFSVATAGMIISGTDDGDYSAAQTETMSAGTQVTDEQTIASLNDYMLLAESLISDGGFGVVSVANDDAEYAAYEYKTTVVIQDLNGNELKYVSYYNQSLEYTHTDRDHPWDNETTEAYSVEGLMIIDGTAYPLTGKFVNETDNKESESTHWLRVELNPAENDYLTVMRESEYEGSESEVEYSYSLYESGTLAKRITFEYESERDETEIEMTISDRVLGTTTTFKIEKETERGREIIKLTVETNGEKRSYTVRTETDENGNTQYVYYSGNNAIWRGDR